MSWQEFVKDYLTFSKRDRLGVLVLASLIVIVFIMPTVLPNNKKTSINTDTSWAKEMQALIIKDSSNKIFYANNRMDDDNGNNYQYDRDNNTNIRKQKGELFYFDPNTLSFEGWQKLGLRDKTIQTIKNYLSKGGRFKKAEDLQKVYGLFPDEYSRIAPFIQIAASVTTVKDSEFSINSQSEMPSTKSNISRLKNININTADTSAFIALPGIGSKLAARIVNFRDKLGGFYSINQVAETFGLSDSTFQKIKQYLVLENTTLRKLNINTATVDDLKAHPYIKYSLANPIVAYRNQHGLFTKVEDIKNVLIVTDEIFKKIAPYLSL